MSTKCKRIYKALKIAPMQQPTCFTVYVNILNQCGALYLITLFPLHANFIQYAANLTVILKTYS